MISVVPKNFFFDRKVVLAFMDQKTARAMVRSLGRIRTIAQRSMRYRKRGTTSASGTPPFAHKETGALLRKLIYFYYSPREKRGIVGPIGRGTNPVPRLHELGGTARRHWRGRTVIVRYPQRAFMEPALRLEKPRLPSYWSSSASIAA